jgi:adenylylsulfate kinase-like enzyme
MGNPFIHGRLALADAHELMERFGDDAGFEAAARAEQFRDLGNVARFCHWRQIERVIATLSSEEITDTIH